MKRDLQRIARYYYLRVIRLRGNPRSLALGAAVGAAIAITPTLPFHTVMIIFTTLLLRVNPVSAILIGAIISNPLTFVPQYWLAWWIGDFFFPGRLSWERLKTVLDELIHTGLVDSLHTLSKLSLDAMLVLFSGGLVLSVVFGAGTYLIAFRFFHKLEQKRQQKHLLH